MAVDIGSLITGPVECDVCLFEWVDTWPAGTHRLECARCGFFTLAPPLADPDDTNRDTDDDGEGVNANA